MSHHTGLTRKPWKLTTTGRPPWGVTPTVPQSLASSLPVASLPVRGEVIEKDRDLLPVPSWYYGGRAASGTPV